MPVIISKDNLNPCVHVLQEHGATWQIAGLAVDLAVMIYSSRFVLARSLLSMAVMYLSPWSKAHYTFHKKGREWGPHVNCEASGEYMRVVWESFWQNSSYQTQMMLSEPCQCSVV
jgi:hypothetical protein